MIKNRECSADALDMIQGLLHWDSKKRLTA
jgi:hypothetical protein